MQIRKGPYGHYAIERAGITAGVYEYAEEIINSDNIRELLSVYTNEQRDALEMAFDFSGLISVDEFMSGRDGPHRSHKDLTKRRQAVRAFIVLLSNMTDMLLFPCSLCRDHRFIFTDRTGTIVRFCSFPLRYDPEDLTLTSIGEDNIEDLLCHPFFTEVLTADEIQQIAYAVSSGNEKMLRDVCSGTDDRKMISGLMSSGVKKTLKLPCSELIFGLICSLTSLFISSPSTIPISFLFFMASVVFVYMAFSGSSITDNVSRSVKDSIDRHSRAKEDPGVSKGRREALFDYDQPAEGLNVLPANVPLIIRGRTAEGADDIKYGMYSERIIIGSDRFLSDLFLDTDDIAPIHAEISRQNGIYFVRPLSTGYHTYLEDRLLEVEHDYELKCGQKLTVGRTDLSLTFGFGY